MTVVTKLLTIASTAVMLAAVPVGPAAAEAAHTGRPIPVIYDSDMDFDDATTLAYLCAEHRQRRIELRAVTVANSGFGIPGRALRHTRTLLEQCGLPHVPVADGATGAGVNPPVAETVPAIEKVLTDALGDGNLPSEPGRFPAAALIRLAAAASPQRVTVLTTGPVSNLAAAFGSGPSAAWLADRIERIYTMGGAINVPGNLFGSALPGFDNVQELNMWMDPVSARHMFRSARPGSIYLVPLDATQYVPLTREDVARLGADQHTFSARLVHRIISHPDFLFLVDNFDMFWWDALAALAAFRNDGNAITSFEDVRLDVIQTGRETGRTLATATGARVRAAFTANDAQFEQTFIDALNERIPRN